MKTSEFPAASDLDGTELVGIVQGETNVKSTTYNIGNVWRNRPNVIIGEITAIYGYSSIAIGYRSTAAGSTSSMAIGSDATSNGFLTLAIGTPTYATGGSTMVIGQYTASIGGFETLAIGMGNYVGGNSSTVVGYNCEAHYDNMVVIGSQMSEGINGTVFIGHSIEAIGPAKSVAIGTNVGVAGPYNVAIGCQYTSAIVRSVAIGFYAGFQRESFEEAGEAGVAIGSSAYIPIGPGVSIGYQNLAVYSGVALGISNLAAAESVAIGVNINAEATLGVGIGHSTLSTNNTVALGNQARAYQSYSTVIGSQIADPAIGGSFVTTGFPVSTPLRPVVFHQKLIGGTTASHKAVAQWGDGSYTAAVTFNTGGSIGNNYVLVVESNGYDESLAAGFDGTHLSILLATNDPSTNTLSNISGLFPTNGFAFGYTEGYGASVVSFGFTENFSGGTDGSSTTILTADGNSPTSNNMPATLNSSLATMTGTVVGATTSLFENSGDAASFTLAPVMVLQKDEAYSFIGTPTFTLASNTDGASDWGAPTLTIVDDETQLQISVTNTEADVNWMAHLTFEASQNNE